MKKYLSILLVLSLVLSAFNVFSVSADDAPTLTIGSVEGAVSGDSIEIPVTITGNTNGVSNYGFYLDYDTTYLTYVDYDDSESIFRTEATVNEYQAGHIIATNAASRNYTTDGILFTLKFTVNNTTETNVSTNITFTDTESAATFQLQYLNDVYDGIDCNPTIVEGTVTINVSDEPVVDPDEPVDDTALGDIDGSTVLTANDAAVLLQYVAGGAANDEWHVSAAVADVNGDGAVTAADAALILDKVLNLSVSFS
ncbi:MAG: dockerin type I domain-containing protein [Clostridiales bacterium]|nr:dockerin type I domain-containing protein [Clostridiales bacterium]